VKILLRKGCDWFGVYKKKNTFAAAKNERVHRQCWDKKGRFCRLLKRQGSKEIDK